MTLASGNIRFMRIFAGVLWRRGALNDSGVVDNSNFQCFRWLYLWKLRDKASILYRDTESVVGFRLIPKDVTFNFVFFCQVQVQDVYFFTYKDSAMISIAHISACGVPEVCIIGIFTYIYGLCIIKSSKRVSADAGLLPQYSVQLNS